MDILSSECGEIFKALALAQGSFPGVPKSGFNPHFKNAFSTLEDIEKSCRPHLKDNGLGYTQVIYEGERTFLVTMLTHSSGQWIRSRVELRPASWDAQKVGAYITYMRRYSLGALLGIAGCEDDDGEEDTKTKDNTKVEVPIVISTKSEFINSKQISQLHNAIRNTGSPDVIRDELFKLFSIGNLNDIKISDYKTALKIITELGKDE